jgi:hypothetical protein
MLGSVEAEEEAVGDPLWLRAFTAVEGTVGPRIEGFVHGKKFSTTVVVIQKVKAGVSGAVERRTRGVWHLVNLPASTDVRKLRNQIGDLDHEVRALRGAMESEARKRTREARRAAQEEPASGTGEVGGRENGSGRSSASSTERGPGSNPPRRGAKRATGAQRDQGDRGGE